MRAQCFFGALTIAVVAPALGSPADEFFRWRDEQGAIHLTDDAKAVPARSRAAREPGQTPAPLSSTKFEAAPRRHVIPVSWEGGRLYVNATVDGRLPIRCILDTGANMTVLPASVASHLGIDRRNSLSIDIRGVGGSIKGRLFEVGSIRVGDAEARPFEVIVVDDRIGGDALLGADFLSRFTMIVNYARGEIILEAGEGSYDGYPAAWWQEKFRLYERLQRLYEQRAGGNGNEAGRMPGRLDSTAETYRSYLAVLKSKIAALHGRADRAQLPSSFRR